MGDIASPKIIFVLPPVSNKELYGNLAAGGNKLPPQNLAGLAALTIRAGYSTDLLDCSALKLSIESSVKEVINKKPDYIGLTATTVTINAAHAFAKLIKSFCPDIKIIIGGPHVTALPEETITLFDSFDYGIIGEGELTLLELLERDRLGKDTDSILGIVTRSECRIVINERREFINDLDSLPFPAWHLLPSIKRYYTPPGDSLNRMPAIGLITSRGCPGKCIFCDNTIFGHRFRSFSVPYLIEMIKRLVIEHGIKDIFFMDDHFMASKKRLINICEALINEQFDLTWSCTGRISPHIDIDLLRLMKRAGCWQICYGVESGSQKILNAINKNILLEHIEPCIRLARNAGLSVKGFFIIGSFMEDRVSIKDTINIIKKLPLTDFHMSYFVPFPGSTAYSVAHKYGAFNNDWKYMNIYKAGCFVPHGLTINDLELYFKIAYRTHYLKAYVIFNYFKKLKNIRSIKKLILSLWAFIRFQIQKL